MIAKLKQALRPLENIRAAVSAAQQFSYEIESPADEASLCRAAAKSRKI